MPRNTGLSVRLYQRYDDKTLLDDLTGRWTSLSYSTALHGGFKDCHLSIPMSISNAWLYMQREAQAGRHYTHLEIMEGFETRWEGRVVSAGMDWSTSAGVALSLTAMGYWSSCRDQRVTTVDYSAGGHTVDSIMKAMLGAHCPDVNADQSNIAVVPGAVNFVLPIDKYVQDHIVDSLAPLGDDANNVYYFAVWDDRLPYYIMRSVSSINWEVRLQDIGRGRISQAGQHLRNAADAYDGAARTASSSDADSQLLYPLRDAVVRVPSGTTAARAQDARDRYIDEHAIPQQESSFLIIGNPIQPLRFGPSIGKRSAIRAGQVIKIIDLIPAATASPELDNLRTFYIVETRYDAARDTVTVIPDRPPAQLRVMLARLGIEVGR